MALTRVQRVKACSVTCDLLADESVEVLKLGHTTRNRPAARWSQARRAGSRKAMHSAYDCNETLWKPTLGGTYPTSTDISPTTAWGMVEETTVFSIVTNRLLPVVEREKVKYRTFRVRTTLRGRCRYMSTCTHDVFSSGYEPNLLPGGVSGSRLFRHDHHQSRELLHF